jgi:hypothetical protein
MHRIFIAQLTVHGDRYRNWDSNRAGDPRYTATANKASPWTPQFKAFGQQEAWDKSAILGFHLPTNITKAAIKNQRPQREQQISTRLTGTNQSLGTPSSSSSCLSDLLLPFLLSRPGTKENRKVISCTVYLQRTSAQATRKVWAYTITLLYSYLCHNTSC